MAYDGNIDGGVVVEGEEWTDDVYREGEESRLKPGSLDTYYGGHSSLMVF